jgi:hypothetical protein
VKWRVKGEVTPHTYPALITKDLFDRCQAVASKRSRTTAVRYSGKPFAFRGLVRCAVSGRVVTSDLKKGRHAYLICRDPADPARKLFVPEAEVLRQVEDVFKSIKVPENVLPALLDHLKTEHAAENRYHLEAVERLRREHDEVRQRLGRLLDLRLDQSITSTEYDKKRAS